MASYSNYKRPIEVILHPDTSHVRVESEADQRYPYHRLMFRKWEKEGRVRFFGTPASINCKEFERDLKNGLPVQYVKTGVRLHDLQASIARIES